MRTVAKSSGVTLGMENGIPIEEVTRQAFIQLGDNGVIKCAQNHSCSECTHKYKETADRIAGDDPAAVLGVDENHQVPVLVGEGAELAIQDAAQARLNAWLGGFETILKRMTVYNFKWFLHAMLFIHTQQVIRKQKLRDDKEGDEDEEGIDIEEELE